MANKKIRELSTGSISNNNDYFVVATNSGDTVKIPYSALATFLFGTSLVQGSNIIIADATQQDGIKRYSITATATGSMWYFGNTQPVDANEDDYWLRTDTEHYGDVNQYDGTIWTNVGTFAGRDGQDGTAATVDVGTVTTGNPGTQASVTNSGTTSAAIFDFTIPRGADGTNGTNGTDGNDGASISASAVPITGGHRLTISSTDPQASDVTFDVMDGTEIIQTTSDDRMVTLAAVDWQGSTAPYTQTISISGMTSSIIPFIAPCYSNTIETALEQKTEWGKITKAISDTNSITFKCYEDKPTVDLTVTVKVV